MDAPSLALASARAAVEAGIFSLRQAQLAGVSRSTVRYRVRVGRWVQQQYGIIIVAGRASREGDDARRALAALSPYGVLSHTSAAAAHALPVIQVAGAVQITVPRGVKRDAPQGVRVYRRRVRLAACLMVGGLPVTSLATTVLDLAEQLPISEAVVAGDAALRSGQLAMMDLARELRRRRHHPNHPQLSDFLTWLDDRSGSVPESRVRVALRRAGLPAPEVQYEVRHAGRLLARVDFAWPQQRLILEVDGLAYHSDGVAFRRDRNRQNALVQAGWRVIRVTAWEAEHRLGYVVSQVRTALD